MTTTANKKDGYNIPDKIDRFHGSIYAAGDYDELKCRIDGNHAELTVGASTGHKAHVDLDKKILDYYDRRGKNNRIMWQLFKIYKITCKRDDTGVHCKGLTTGTKINGAFRVLAVPTSMDYRWSHCTSHYSEEECIKAEVDFFKSGPMHTVKKEFQ